MMAVPTSTTAISGGLSLRPQQRRSDNTVPIAFLGKSDQPIVSAWRSWAARPLAAARSSWSGRSSRAARCSTARLCSAAPIWLDTGTAGAQLDELVAGLQQDTLYHWRVRLLYHPATTPFQQYSRWITNPWNGWNEAAPAHRRAANSRDVGHFHLRTKGRQSPAGMVGGGDAGASHGNQWRADETQGQNRTRISSQRTDGPPKDRQLWNNQLGGPQ